jgi:type I restriction enzyme S subunit
MTTGTTRRKKLIQVRLIAAPYALPPLAEQHRIVAEVERQLSIVEDIERSVAANLKRTERFRQSILQRAFSGKLVPQDPNDEPASVLLERIRAEKKPDRKNAQSALPM